MSGGGIAGNYLIINQTYIHMAYATGLRLLAAINFFLCLTILLAPVCGPLGIFFWRKAKKKEKAKEQEQKALQKISESGEE